MCVIFFAEKTRPTESMIDRAWSRNDDGGGIAWREKDEKTEEVMVNWKKGLSLDEMQKMAAELPLPYIMHFRIASVGGPLPQLTHPFPVDREGRNFLNGKTKGYVLFHNGHYNDWKKDMKEAALRYGKRIPDGKWSDTRAMAWIASMAGVNYMEMIEEKGIAFSPRNMELFWGAGWYQVGDVWCSNTYWTNSTPKKHSSSDPTGAYGRGEADDLVYNGANYTICIAPKCQIRDNLDANGYCPQHSKFRPNFADADLLPVLVKKPNNTPLPNEEDEQSGGTGADTPFDRWQMAKTNFINRKIGTREYKRARRAYETYLQANGLDNDIPTLYVKPERIPEIGSQS